MSNKVHIKKGDNVKILAGDSKGKTGKVLEVVVDKYKAIVENVNLATKHTKPSAKSPKGGILKQEWLREMAIEMGETANKWREFSYYGSRNCKKRGKADQSYDFLADMLLDCADREEKIFRKLAKIK